MKRNILFFFLSLFAFAVQAQIIEIEHPVTEASFQVDLTDNWAEPIVHGNVINVSNDPILLRWELETPDGPAEWEYRVCDKNQCYSTAITSNVDPNVPIDIPVELQPGDTSLLDLHILPRMVAGTCTAKIHLSLASDPNTVIATATYIAHIEGLTSTTEAQKSALQLFPNPTSDYFRLKADDVVDQIVVYNLLGRPVRTFAATPGNVYPMGDLPNGLYLVSLIDRDQDIIKTVRVTKQSFRP
ncbi:MAG: T9SS C-terminal target domain-containing protein [Bacteroidetes bacterium]|nr:MAG: T9SS C-terminal target domain-containing protein [Bacteroidota bacterium]